MLRSGRMEKGLNGLGASRWHDKRILITGGAGFLGAHVVAELKRRGCRHLLVPRSSEYDLRDGRQVNRLFSHSRPQLVIHLAGTVGGIGVNRSHPGTFFYDNAMMGIQVMEVARCFGAEKFVTIGTICAYPKHTLIPFREDDLWHGYPEETNAAYGLAKKMLLVQGQAYRAEYGFNAIYLLPTNLYGPGDNFDLRTSHVIPAIIRKCVEAVRTGGHEVVLWGDGSATRDFLFVADAARGIVLAAEHYDEGAPVNLGSGRETSIRELATLIAQQTGFHGRFVWDTTQPAGQPRRVVDTSRAKRRFGFAPREDLPQGLRKTLLWYLATLNSAPVEVYSGMQLC